MLEASAQLIDDLLQTGERRFLGSACALLEPESLTRWRTSFWHAQEIVSDPGGLLPPFIGFSTSGHTGKPVLWLRSAKQLLAEVALLQDICRSERADGIISFAPVEHLYGFLCTFLLAGVQKLPVWYQPMSSPQPLRYQQLQRPIIFTIPSALALLFRTRHTLQAFETLTLVHSSAMLPPAGRQLVQAGLPNLTLIELFGSTETGLVATREIGDEPDQPWVLAEDVSFAQALAGQEETRLEVCSPRLAYQSTGARLTSWQMDDYIQPLDQRRFCFHGRRSSVLKINGQRVDLDAIEQVLRQVIPCRDLACIASRDDYRGEAFQLLIVPDERHPLTQQRVGQLCRQHLTHLPFPRNILFTTVIHRSALGKVHLQQGVPHEE